MKSIHIFLFLLSLIYVCSSECTSTPNPSSSKDCKGKQTSDPYCCYAKIKHSSGEINECSSLSKTLYDNIKIAKSGLETACSLLLYKDCKVKKLDCKSSYLSFGLFSLILLLL